MIDTPALVGWGEREEGEECRTSSSPEMVSKAAKGDVLFLLNILNISKMECRRVNALSEGENQL